MIQRILKLPKRGSILLLGPRGTGKSSLIRGCFKEDKKTLWIDLLDPALEELYVQNPSRLGEEITAGKYRTVVIDEVQKCPALLNVAHRFIESSGVQFVLTGSSARKLRRGAANLLAGRAFSFQLSPLTHRELGDRFNLQEALEFGTLPKLFFPSGATAPRQIKWSTEEKVLFLQSYARTYLKEEIQVEQLVRKVEPFRGFLRVAAQMNGKVIEYSKIAEEVHVDPKTVTEYFSILEDTLVGFLLHPYHRSIRKRQGKKPKFYWFDTGVKRAMDQTLSVPLLPQTSAYGEAFEHWVILEVRRLAQAINPDIELSYFRTSDDAQEVDLIVERPGKLPALVEIKSSESVTDSKVSKLAVFKKDFPKSDFFILSREKRARVHDGVWVGPWQEGIQQILG